MCLGILVTCMPLYIMYVRCPWSPEEAIGFPRNIVRDGYELSCRHWEWTLGSLEDQQMVLTPGPSPSLLLLLFLKVTAFGSLSF